MKHIIIGTAGHVDHGKTALIGALTGTDTDRLKEEKARGISIDLGFAALPLGEEVTAGIVDVPGHERFLKNMLAGTGGIDLAMLVIAADEGIMPQTREHLAMLELYGVKYGVVALNKVDKVDAEWLELVEEDVRSFLADTFLAGAPLCRVSAFSGDGIPQLRQTLLAVAEQLPGRDSTAPFRLWVDRAFTVKGHGAVVTGSALSGTIAVGDGLRLYPQADAVRVRGLEWHGKKVERIFAGQRSAINISGVDTEVLERGMALSAPERGQVGGVWDIAADWRREVASGTRVRLHLGTGEYIGRLYFYKDIACRYARLALEKPLAAGLGDRGILRLYSPQYLLAGVTMLAPAGRNHKLPPARITLAEAVAGGDCRGIVASLITDAGQPVAPEEIKLRAGYITDKKINAALAELAEDGVVVLMGGYYLTGVMLEALKTALAGLLEDYHRRQPDRAGLSKDIIRQKLGIRERPFEILLEHWLKKEMIAITGAEVALKAFAGKHGDWRQDLVARAEAALADLGLVSVDQQMLAGRLGLPADKLRSAHEILLREGTLIRISDMYYTRAAIQRAAGLVKRHLAANASITVAELRDILGMSRKVALPLLEYYDTVKITVRDGDVRRGGPRLREVAD